jgi:predicted phosphodiesterase
MDIAIVADTHGNLTALNAVLSEIEREGIDDIVCLGDVAGLGPQPVETIERLRALSCPIVMGNADEFLLDSSLVDPARHPDADESTSNMHDAERWCADQLHPEDLQFIRTFRPTVEISIDDGRTLLCYHGSPRSAWEEIRASTPDAELAEMLGDQRAAVMAGGHTHEQFFRRLDETIVINPGSVGLPFEYLQAGGARNPPWAEYAVLKVESGRLEVDLRRTLVDLVTFRRSLIDSGMPHAEWFAADWH